MNKILLIVRKNVLSISLFLGAVSYGQVNFTDSNLPIFIITTDNDPNTGQPMEIPDDPKIWASLKIIYHADGSRNYMTDQNTPEFLNYNARIKIETRGSSSQMLEKKQYGWTTYDTAGAKQNVSLLGMPSENDWILNGLAFDASLMRDYINYNLARALGQYASRTHYCEVVINGNYRGLYVLQEKIKDDSNRVNIEEITDEDNSGVNLTGGYITKADKTTGGDPVAWTMESYDGLTDFIHELPKPEDVTDEQNDYIHSQFTSLETLTGTDNDNIGTGYPSVIDVPTFIDFMIMNEFSANVDAYQISTFFHKDRGGKLRAGPVWDFNLSLGHDEFGNRSVIDQWQFDNDNNTGAKFWKDLFDNDTYKCYFAKRWNQVTSLGQPLNYDSVEDFIDATALLINEASVRENQRWGTVPNLQNELNDVKDFILDRIDWIDANIGTFTACNTIEVPSLVISGINYNPGENTEFPESDDQEFIEITNTGSESVDLTGVYLSELGLSYQFPVASSIAAGQKIYIVSNATVFEQKHDITAFGQYVRHMSNKSQKLVLSDAFGNRIDEVQYADSSPWPNADGNGKFLHLTDNALDNSLASSWSADEDMTLSAKTFTVGAVKIYPNPVNELVTIDSVNLIRNIEVYDMTGKQLTAVNPNSNTIVINFAKYSSGIYLVKITGETGTMTQKIVKQ
ncbi:MAG: secretion system protein Por [Flavobacterium psychrophilum]|nr:MAG: secretion system protein Por [Flavobacterium psychrophilum]